MAEILLVGSLNGVLGKLATALGTSEPDWSIRQIAGADAAVDQIRRRTADLVLAAYPTTDSSAEESDSYNVLFQRVAQESPATIRLALIAQHEPLPDKLAFAHQTLVVRDNMDYLRPILSAALEVAEKVRAHPQLQQIICNLESVPSPPTLYFDIREQIEDPNSDVAQMAEITARDPSLVARILKLVNSGFYALPRSVADLKDAISLMGTDTLLGLVLTAHLYAGLPPPGLRLELLRDHTFRVSTLARQITQAQGGNRSVQSQSAVAGLLHDIGLMVLLENEPARYQPLWSRCHNDEAALAEMERETFGVTHGELGALILSLWSLPVEVVEAVANSHAPAQLYPCDPAEPSLVSQSVAAAAWLLDTASEDAPDQTPGTLQGMSEATVSSWRNLRDELYGEAVSA